MKVCLHWTKWVSWDNRAEVSKNAKSLFNRVRTVLKSPWILVEVLEKSLNSIFPWKVLKFLCKSLKSPWIFLNFECSGLESVFWCFFPRQNINHSSENLKVIYIKRSMFYAIINCQFKTSELSEKCREVGEANSSSLKALLE